MLRIAIIIGSTRPGRNGEAVAKWVYEIAQKRGDAEFELVDIKDFNLPLLDEPVPPIMGQYSKPHTKAWAAKIGSFDGYVFVTPEYNHGISGALKNAIDFLFAEWNNKAAGFVSYGGVGGVRAVEQLRLVLAEVQMATVRNQVLLSLFTDFENFSVFKPGPSKGKVGQRHARSAHRLGRRIENIAEDFRTQRRKVMKRFDNLSPGVGMGILDKKVVLITGTGGGLGRVAAQTFAREGAKVVGCDIKADANNETVELIRRAGGEMTGIAPIDLTDPNRRGRWLRMPSPPTAGSTLSTTTRPYNTSVRCPISLSKTGGRP